MMTSSSMGDLDQSDGCPQPIPSGGGDGVAAKVDGAADGWRRAVAFP